jgi:hypothetical protein
MNSSDKKESKKKRKYASYSSHMAAKETEAQPATLISYRGHWA